MGNLFLFYVYVFVRVSSCKSTQGQEGGIESPEARVTGSCEMLKMGPLLEHKLLFTTEAPLQSLELILINKGVLRQGSLFRKAFLFGELYIWHTFI